MGRSTLYNQGRWSVEGFEVEQLSRRREKGKKLDEPASTQHVRDTPDQKLPVPHSKLSHPLRKKRPYPDDVDKLFPTVPTASDSFSGAMVRKRY
jgi:hypothetical protein